MTTKQEIAEGLTVEQLRSLADEHGIDLSGASNKAEIVDRVTAGASKEQLEAYVPDEEGANAGAATSQGGYVSPKELAEQGLSAADLEIGSPIIGGEPQIIKAWPERQSQAEVDQATSEQAGPPAVAVIVSDGESEFEHELRPDDAARLSVAIGPEQHPIHQAVGHGSNPNHAGWAEGENREEAIAANEEEYASRVSA